MPRRRSKTPLPPLPPTTTRGDDAGGNMFGDAIGDAFGAGGLGLSGVGEGTGGAGAGIGLGNIGDGGGHGTPASTPRVRQGQPAVYGRLPPEVIRRIVRQIIPRARRCYENGLKKNAKLAGTVTVTFTIATTGYISSLASRNSTLPDKDTVSCVVHAFSDLSFPQPEGGTVSVVYPMVFAPAP